MELYCLLTSVVLPISLSRGFTGDFLLAIFWNRQQTLKIFRVATHKRAIRQPGKVVKFNCDNFNMLNISRWVDKIFCRVAVSTVNSTRRTVNWPMRCENETEAFKSYRQSYQSSKIKMAEETFCEEITFKLIAFLEQNRDILKSTSRETRQNLKEKLRDQGRIQHDLFFVFFFIGAALSSKMTQIAFKFSNVSFSSAIFVYRTKSSSRA